MKNSSLASPLLGLLLLVVSPTVHAQELAPVNDRDIIASLEKEIGKLEDDEALPRVGDEPLSLAPKSAGVSYPELATFDSLREGLPQALESTVILGNVYKCDKCDKWHAKAAGGVLVSEDGLLLTNYHVLESSKGHVMVARTRDGKFHRVLEVLATNKRADVALLQLEGEGFTAASVAAKSAQVLEEILVVSHPDQKFYVATRGAVSRYASRPKGKLAKPSLWMEITADFAGGSSGCGVFNSRGELVGLATSTESLYYNEEEQKNFQMVIKNCVPVSAMRALLVGKGS